jgi:hypothetical protein
MIGTSAHELALFCWAKEGFMHKVWFCIHCALLYKLGEATKERSQDSNVRSLGRKFVIGSITDRSTILPMFRLPMDFVNDLLYGTTLIQLTLLATAKQTGVDVALRRGVLHVTVLEPRWAFQFEPLMMALRLSLGYQSLGTYWDAS